MSIRHIKSFSCQQLNGLKSCLDTIFQLIIVRIKPTQLLISHHIYIKNPRKENNSSSWKFEELLSFANLTNNSLSKEPLETYVKTSSVGQALNCNKKVHRYAKLDQLINRTYYGLFKVTINTSHPTKALIDIIVE